MHIGVVPKPRNLFYDHLPFTVGEHELSQLEITQYDALLVARFDHFAHLTEQPASFRLSEPLPDADMRVEIALIGSDREAKGKEGKQILVSFALRAGGMGEIKWNE